MSPTPEFVPRLAIQPELHKRLIDSGIPLVSLAQACQGCPEDGDVDDYPTGLDIDQTTDLLGTMSGYGRQILISTGKSDWQKEVTDREVGKESLAYYVNNVYQQREPRKTVIAVEGEDRLPGIYSTTTTTQDEVPSLDALSLDNHNLMQLPSKGLSVLNSSFLSSSEAHHHKSIIVLPDFISVHDVEETEEAATELIDRYLSPKSTSEGIRREESKSETKSWPLPYEAVVLICSHKKRDKRCHIAAPLLIHQFHHHLESHDLEVDERGDDIISGPPLESYPDPKIRATKLEESLKGVKTNGGRVLVAKISHIGGHKYAGNVIIYLPNGTAIWYGRVTPRDVGAIVQSTIIEGKVIPELLRGGFGITGKSSKEGILAW